MYSDGSDQTGQMSMPIGVFTERKAQKSLVLSHIGSSIITTDEYEPRCMKTGPRGFRQGPTQTGLYSHRRWIEAWNFGFRKLRDRTICVAKTKALISFAVTAKLICVFVFAYAKSRFSHDEAHIMILTCTGLFDVRSFL